MIRGQLHKGFTIVELLVVIVVIGILAAVSIVAFNGIQDRAKSAAIVSDINKVEDGLLMLALESGRSVWWFDNNELVSGVSHPTVEQIIASTSLKNYLQARSNISGTGTSWYYDSDPEPIASNPHRYFGCDATDYDGVNLFIANVSSTIALSVDKTLDDGNLGCGSVTQNGTLLRYNLSPHISEMN